MANGTDDIKDEFKKLSAETAAIFQETLTSIAAAFGEKLRDETSTLDEAQKQLLRNFKNNISSSARTASSLLDIQDKLRDGSLKERDIKKSITSIESRINKFLVDRIALEQSGVVLTNKQLEDAENTVTAFENQISKLTAIDKIQKDVAKELGLAGKAATVLDNAFKALGLSNPFGEALEKTKAARASIKSNQVEIDKLTKLGRKRTKTEEDTLNNLISQNKESKKSISLGKNIAESFSLQNVGAATLTLLATRFVSAFNDLNRAQVDSVRSTGELVDFQGVYNDSLLLGIDYLNQVNSLTEQFGFNTIKAFDAINITEAAELTKFMGLAAGEANALALNAQISGENLKDGADQAVRAINPAFSQRKILQDIAKLSAAIAISFENSNVALAKAASDAKELGLNLNQVDKIAGSLLDIESSIAKEFEAEVISGRQLNLEQARMFALTNDLAGVTRELTKQGIDQESFTKANRIEQEAIAAAVGLSRDELAASIQEQAILGKMSQEEIEAKEASDLKSLTAQQMLNDSITKMAEALAVPAAFFAGMLNSTSGLIGIMLALSPLIASAAISAFQMAISLGFTKGFAGFALGAGLIAMLAAGISGVIKAQKVGDAILPASGGPVVSTMEGGIFQGTSNDDVLMGPGLAVSPNISRENTRNNNTQLDYEKLANAIAMGAEKGTSRANVTTNLDGSKVSNRIQAPLAMNTRKYSV